MAAAVAALLGQAALNIGVNELNRARTNSDAKKMAYLNNNLNRQNVVDSALLTKTGYQNAGLSTAAMSSPMTVSAVNAQPAVSAASPPDVSSIMSAMSTVKVNNAQAKLLKEQAEEQKIKNDQTKYLSEVIASKQGSFEPTKVEGIELDDVYATSTAPKEKKYIYNKENYDFLKGGFDSKIDSEISSNKLTVEKNKYDMAVLSRQINDKKLLDKVAALPAKEYDKLVKTLDGLDKANALADIEIYIKEKIKNNEISLSNYEVFMSDLAKKAAQNDLDHDIFTQIDKLFDKKDFDLKDIFKFMAVLIGSIVKGAGSLSGFSSVFGRGRR